MLFHPFKSLEEPVLIFLLQAPFVESVGMLMSLQRLFFVSHEPDRQGVCTLCISPSWSSPAPREAAPC